MNPTWAFVFLLEERICMCHSVRIQPRDVLDGRAKQSPGVLTTWLEGEPAHRCEEPFMPCPGPQGDGGSVSRPDSRASSEAAKLGMEGVSLWYRPSRGPGPRLKAGLSLATVRAGRGPSAPGSLGTSRLGLLQTRNTGLVLNKAAALQNFEFKKLSGVCFCP